MKKWIVSHPTATACGIAALCASNITALIAYDVFNRQAKFDNEDFILHAAMLITVSALWFLAAKTLKPAALLVALGLFVHQPARAAELPRQDHPALVIGVGVGIGIGAWVWWKINRCSKKIARNQTNGWPADEIVGPTEYGAAFTWAEACYAADRRTTNGAPTACTLNIFVESQSNLTVTVRADTGERFVESLDDYCKGELVAHGLSVPAQPESSACYEVNRRPAEMWQVPIRFDRDTHTATFGAGGVLVTIESSGDLREWKPLTALNVPVGKRIRFDDVSYGKRFYRAIPK